MPRTMGYDLPVSSLTSSPSSMTPRAPRAFFNVRGASVTGSVSISSSFSRITVSQPLFFVAHGRAAVRHRASSSSSREQLADDARAVAVRRLAPHRQRERVPQHLRRGDGPLSPAAPSELLAREQPVASEPVVREPLPAPRRERPPEPALAGHAEARLFPIRQRGAEAARVERLEDALPVRDPHREPHSRLDQPMV